MEAAPSGHQAVGPGHPLPGPAPDHPLPGRVAEWEGTQSSPRPPPSSSHTSPGRGGRNLHTSAPPPTLRLWGSATMPKELPCPSHCIHQGPLHMALNRPHHAGLWSWSEPGLPLGGKAHCLPPPPPAHGHTDMLPSLPHYPPVTASDRGSAAPTASALAKANLHHTPPKKMRPRPADAFPDPPRSRAGVPPPPASALTAKGTHALAAKGSSPPPPGLSSAGTRTRAGCSLLIPPPWRAGRGLSPRVPLSEPSSSPRQSRLGSARGASAARPFVSGPTHRLRVAHGRDRLLTGCQARKSGRLAWHSRATQPGSRLPWEWRERARSSSPARRARAQGAWEEGTPRPPVPRCLPQNRPP